VTLLKFIYTSVHIFNIFVLIVCFRLINFVFQTLLFCWWKFSYLHIAHCSDYVHQFDSHSATIAV